MKIQALLLATVLAGPAMAEVSFVHNSDGTVTRVETTRTIVKNQSATTARVAGKESILNEEAAIDAAAARPLTVEEQAKLSESEVAPTNNTEQAHQRAINNARAAGENPEIETSAGYFNGINYQDRSLSGYQDPYATNNRAYRSNENGQAAVAPSENIFVEGTAGTRWEDRSGAVVTGTKAFLNR